MITTSGNGDHKLSKAIGFLFLIALVIAGVVIAVDLFKLKKGIPMEVFIDKTEDSRGLGYSGQRKVAFDSKGNAYVAYRKKHQGNYEIFVARVLKKGNDVSVFGTDKPIASIKNSNQRVPSIAIDSRDTIHIAWYGSDDPKNENNRQIKYARSEDYGMTWSSWRNISYVSGYSSKEEYWQEHPSIIVGRDNSLYIVWEGKDNQNKNQQIKFSSSINGGTSWSQWKNIKPAANNTQSRPSISENPDGSLHLFIYSSLNNGNKTQQIQYSTSKDAGANWTQWQAISDPNSDARHISSISDSKGTVHLAWRANKAVNSPSQIFYRSLSNGQWSQATTISPSPRFQFFPNIGMNESKSVFVTWMENNGPSGLPNENPEGGQLFVSSLQDDGTFQQAISVAPSDYSILYPNVPLGSNHSQLLFVTYEQAQGSDFSIILKSIDVKK